MSNIETREEAREEANIIQTGRWYIAELDDPALVVQGESEADAREKMAKRWENYTSETDHSDIELDDPTFERDYDPIDDAKIRTAFDD